MRHHVFLCCGWTLLFMIHFASPSNAWHQPEVDCQMDDDGSNRQLSACLRHGEQFIREYMKSLKWNRPEFDTCGEFGELRACIMPFVTQCPGIKQLLYGTWLPILDLLDCACNESRECADTLECFEEESRGILVERCDSMYKFNLRQRANDPCYFIRDNIKCKEALVRTACNERAGLFAFHVAKISRQNRIAKRRCYISRDQTYSGFRYSDACPAEFKDKMATCYELYLSDHQLAFDADNELVVRTKRHKEIKSSCRKYRFYRRCIRPLKSSCPSGVDLIYNYDSELRTYNAKMDYICRGETHGEYLDNLNCYQGVLRNRTLMQCNPVWEELKPSLDVVTSFQFYCIPTHRDSALLRGRLNKLRVCYETMFRDRCGDVAADVIGRLIEQAFDDPYYLRMQYRPACDLYEQASYTVASPVRLPRLGDWRPPGAASQLTPIAGSTNTPSAYRDVSRTSSSSSGARATGVTSRTSSISALLSVLLLSTWFCCGR